MGYTFLVQGTFGEVAGHSLDLDLDFHHRPYDLRTLVVDTADPVDPFRDVAFAYNQVVPSAVVRFAEIVFELEKAETVHYLLLVVWYHLQDRLPREVLCR